MLEPLDIFSCQFRDLSGLIVYVRTLLMMSGPDVGTLDPAFAQEFPFLKLSLQSSGKSSINRNSQKWRENPKGNKEIYSPVTQKPFQHQDPPEGGKE